MFYSMLRPQNDFSICFYSQGSKKICGFNKKKFLSEFEWNKKCCSDLHNKIIWFLSVCGTAKPFHSVNETNRESV
jgi:hypothetical protein